MDRWDTIGATGLAETKREREARAAISGEQQIQRNGGTSRDRTTAMMTTMMTMSLMITTKPTAITFLQKRDSWLWSDRGVCLSHMRTLVAKICQNRRSRNYLNFGCFILHLSPHLAVPVLRKIPFSPWLLSQSPANHCRIRVWQEEETSTLLLLRFLKFAGNLG